LSRAVDSREKRGKNKETQIKLGTKEKGDGSKHTIHVGTTDRRKKNMLKARGGWGGTAGGEKRQED